MDILRKQSPHGLRALTLAALLVMAWVAPARASDEWCSGDPALVLTTPHGHTFVVFTAAAAYGVRYLPDVLLAANSYTATNYVRDDAGDLGTAFTVAVTVPKDLVAGSFPVQAYVSSGPGATGALSISDPAGGATLQYAIATGTVYAGGAGTSGTPVLLTFEYPVP